MRPLFLVAAILSATQAVGTPAAAWVASAHAKIAEAAVTALPDSMPPFFRASAARIGSSAVEPDYYRHRDLPQLSNSESPEHYLDSELLNGKEWPSTRYEFLQLAADLDRNPYFVGTLPYSIAEGVQLLAASFAQVRLNPGDEWAQAKALHHAGILAHYSADLCQPLHTTIHFNGRARADGSSPGTGVHSKTDNLANAVFAEELEGGLGFGALEGIEGASDLWRAIRSEFAASHALVDRVYALESGLEPGHLSPEALEFARERVAASVRFTASLFVTAWDLSAELSLPGWFREFQDEAVPPLGTVSPR